MNDAVDQSPNASAHTAHGGGAPVPEGYVTKAEVARRLKKTVRTVENWQQRGILPFMKCGRSVLFKWSDVEAHLQKHFRVCRLTVTKSGLRSGDPMQGGK